MKLLWLDLETTGLIASKHRILEVAASLAEFTNPFDAKEVYHAVLELPLATPLDPYIVEMHTKNELLPECYMSKTTLEEAENALLEIVPEAADKEERPVLAGSTIHFDHEFIRQHMPRLAARLSHRHYDVSAIKLFCQSMGMDKFQKKEAHRASEDVRESIEHGKACAQWLADCVARQVQR